MKYAFDEWFEDHFIDPDGGSAHLPDWLKDDLRLAWNAALGSIPNVAARAEQTDANTVFLRKLVDVVWNEATESAAVPSTKWADKLILRARHLCPVSEPQPSAAGPKDGTCYVERSKVRAILIEQPDVDTETTSYILHDIDVLPIFTAEDFRDLPQASADAADTTCYVERSKVRAILIEQPDVDAETTSYILHEIDALPIFTADDFRALPQSLPTREAIARIIDPGAKFENIEGVVWSRFEVQRRDLAYLRADEVLAACSVSRPMREYEPGMNPVDDAEFGMKP